MIWFNGQLASAARLDATGAGALLGWGVFTTLRVREGAPVFWEYHAARLKRDAATARVEMPFDGAQLRAGLDELTNALGTREALARITGTKRGDGRWNAEEGTDWSILLQTAPAPSTEPLQLEVSPHRVAARAPLAGAKTTSYLPYLLAWQAARERGFDEALLLTESGWVCEGARASIFWEKAGELFTPSLKCGCLRGVGREVVLQRIGAREGEWRLAELWEADGAFLVSGAAGARAITTIRARRQTRKWNDVGALTRQVQKELWANMR